jgi:hypothetical protein
LTAMLLATVNATPLLHPQHSGWLYANMLLTLLHTLWTHLLLK